MLILSTIPVPKTDVGPKGLDKIVHFTIYGITALLFWKFLYNKGGQGIIALISVLTATLYGLIIELIQSLLPYRSFSVSDILSNFLGAVTFVVLWRINPFQTLR
ncbi:MAG: VanZ family protein [Thermodesulfovibrionales bacterium]